MKAINLNSELELTFERASALADDMAVSLLGEATTCLSWYDKLRDHECPQHASECHDDTCDIPGYEEYAESRGAALKVNINEGTFVFCYVTVEEFQ